MYDDGLIYQGDYFVNWDPSHKQPFPMTKWSMKNEILSFGISDILWLMGRRLVVATTRPETMLGDTALPSIQQILRYAAVIGKQIRLPLTGRLIPIIADPFVDPAFGTGAVKITPAHDFNDFEVATATIFPSSTS